MNHPNRSVKSNAGSLARDHLANERTFLAWVRTALAVIGLGVLVGKLVETDGVLAEIIGLALVAFGAAMLIYSVIRFERVTTLLDERMFIAARWGPIVLAGLGLLVAIGSVVLLVT
jgi:putative membrane protein